ncbi:hypothetical protein KW076_01250 [Micrococcus porci]|uniref:hypothetical protein n=1 Tax=Micrococcus porci TaxID=2856555 RepID=UPI001CCDC463|nr:hypothetical protein [Micrococcus porci]UBH24856.1 hypothetical protein KW076_01250 [Micrococcus porci]
MAKNHSARAADPQQSETRQKAEAAAGAAQDQAAGVAQDAKAHAQDLAQSAQQEAVAVKDEAVQHAKSLAGSLQDQAAQQASTQQGRLAEQSRGITDDLHRLLSGEQPQGDAVRQAVAAVADRAETLTQRLETAQPMDLVDDVRRFAARRPGTFLAIALGAGVLAGRMTRGVRDASQDGPASLSSAPRTPQHRRELEPQGVQADVTPHHLDSQIPAHTGDDAPRPVSDTAAGLPYGTEPLPTIDPLTGEPVAEDPYDQTRDGGRA